MQYPITIDDFRKKYPALQVDAAVGSDGRMFIRRGLAYYTQDKEMRPGKVGGWRLLKDSIICVSKQAGGLELPDQFDWIPVKTHRVNTREGYMVFYGATVSCIDDEDPYGGHPSRGVGNFINDDVSPLALCPRDEFLGGIAVATYTYPYVFYFQREEDAVIFKAMEYTDIGASLSRAVDLAAIRERRKAEAAARLAGVKKR